MSDMKKRWFSQQVNKYRLLIFLLWAGSVAAFGMAGYLIAQNWDEILANPYAWDVLYTLTMSGKAWSAFCAVTSVLLAVIAIRVQATSLRYYKMRGTRSMRSSGSKRWAGGEPPKPTRIQPQRSCKSAM
ncbi:transmembrane protein [Cystoisospora suis]|uniref:Transmembrane protein n=1 Tax=Cystoisospora suis TaxID=483139 RepID=A0A2C6KGK4_9APIC|nr:transmembrane protein [Cystoisospora suis]